MKGYKTIKDPTGADIISATIKVSYMATILTSAQAAADKVGDAAYLHDTYNTVDEVAASMYAAEIGQPEDTFSSRRQADGSKSEYPEDVKAARKRRSPEASEAIDAKALDIWRRHKTHIEEDYPFFAVLGLAINYVNAHCFLCDDIGQEINRADFAAEQADYTGTTYIKGDPSANLISWLTAVFLTTHEKYYKALLKDWINTISSMEAYLSADVVADSRTYSRIYTQFPQIRMDFFRLLDDYFSFHFANSKKAAKGNSGVDFEGTFNAFVEQYAAPTLFVPNISEDTYRRYRGK